jgi:hypothetical protein
MRLEKAQGKAALSRRRIYEERGYERVFKKIKRKKR